MKINVKHGSITDIACDVLIVNLFEGVKSPGGAAAAVDKALDSFISSYVIEKEDFKGKLGDVYVLPTYGKIPADKIIVVGLGKSEEFNLAKIREVSSKAIQKAISLKAQKVCSIVHGAGIACLDVAESAQMLAEGTILGSYKFTKYKSKKEDEKAIKDFEIVESDKSKLDAINKGIKKGIIIAESTNKARNLANEPANELNPAKLAEIAKAIEDIECRIYRKEDILNMGMGAYYAVAKGSENSPKFIHMIYRPSGKIKKKVAIIGKGVTFDSGGLCIKPPSGMVLMKDDMAGAAAVLSVMKALPKLKPNVEVHAIIAACENMLDGNAYRPGDVVKAMNGKTIEIDNTDAEGRLTLADALCYAVDLNVDEIVDVATLTGACMVALGRMASGIMGNNQELIDKLISSANQGGERLWQLPMYEEYFDSMKSDIADFKNSGSREAGASSAALFLKEFVNNVPWAHIDIAGPAWLDKEVKELGKGASGAAVRTLINYILNTK
ncbi:MAG: leucyl aminopeptidase [bacterium]